MRKKLFIFLLAVLTGTGTLFAQSSIGETRIWPLLLDDELRDMYSSQIVYDLSQDDTESFLFIWGDATYTSGTASVQDGNSISLIVADQGWAGGGFCQTGQVGNEAVRSLRNRIVSNPEQYYLHLSIKSSDSYSHCFYVFNTEDTKFVLGNHSVYDGPVLQDFPRDGEWHDIIVPMSPYASALASVDLTNYVNVLAFLSEGVQGAELSLRNVYFYTLEGDNLTWDLTDSTLTISGTGAMTDYSIYSLSNRAPWYSSSSSITSVVINDGVTSIGNGAFYYCTSLTSVTIGNSVTSIGDYAFSGCSGLTSVTIPNSVTSMGSSAFSYCDSLASVTLHSNAIVSKTYTSSSNIRSIFGSQVTEYIIGDSVTSIGSSAFEGCSSLASVTIGNSVTSIGSSAFEGCSSLASVTIGNSVTSIGDYAFGYCSSLTSIEIPNSVTSIGDYAFRDCSSLTSVVWNAKNCSDFSDYFIAPFYDIRTQITSFVFGDEVEHIPACLCYGMSSLISVTIPNSVKSIGNYAFYGCSGLTSIEIPNSVTSIGKEAFYNCSSLTSIVIPNSVISIGDWAFYNCSGLNTVHYAGTLEQWCNKSWSPERISSNDYSLYINDELVTSVSIPATIKAIKPFTFYGCQSLTSVAIHSGVEQIGMLAFFQTGIDGNEANWDNNMLYIDNCLIGIREDESYGEEDVRKIVIKEGTRVIADMPNYYTQMQSGGGTQRWTIDKIPESVTRIGVQTFIGYEIDTLTIPDNVTSIGEMAAGYCFLTSVRIGYGVTRIPYGAFMNCPELRTIVLGKNVKEIDRFAIANDFSSRLSTIVCYADRVPDIVKDDEHTYSKDYINTDDYIFNWSYIPITREDLPDVFFGVSRKAYLYVPANLVRDYEAHPVWGEFIVRAIGAEPTTIAGNNVVVTPSSTSAQLAWPTISGAASYEIVVTDTDGNAVDTLTFNSEGDMTGKHLAPAKNVETNAFMYTVTGLEENTTYNYIITAKDEEGNVLDTKSGSFVTKGGSEGLEEIKVNSECQKLLREGNIYIIRDNKVFSITGQEVK